MTDLRTYIQEDAACGNEMFYTEVGEAATNCPDGTTRYVLRAGDTLATVAARFNVTPQQIYAANPDYDPKTYKAGSSLCVPIPSEAAQCPTAQLYRVRAGDTIEAVLQHFQVTQEALFQLNPSVATHGLIPGELICIPTKTQAPEAQPKPAIPLNPSIPAPGVPQTPLTPAKPAQPAPKPVAPTPQVPLNPPTPTPEIPQTPLTPAKPVQPVQPVPAPSVPQTPLEPAKPAPQVPQTPLTPAKPVQPAPSQPSTPVRPPETVLPVVPEMPVAPCLGGGERITVRDGETLGSILVGYNIAYAALNAVNPGVNLRDLRTGQSLCVPPGGSRGNCRTCTDMYTMGPGENLASVARARRRPVEDLLAWNPTLLPSDFASGQRICLS